MSKIKPQADRPVLSVDKGIAVAQRPSAIREVLVLP